MKIKLFGFAALWNVRRLIAWVICLPARLWFRFRLSLAIWGLVSLNNFMREKRYDRNDRRQLWRDIVKSIENRDEIFQHLKHWKP